MHQIKISKGNGKTRTIFIPNREEKTNLQSLLPALNQLALTACGPAVHGFLPGKSPITNAAAHVDKAYSLSFDLENFFDTVNTNHLHRLSPSQLNKVLVNGAPRQGLPTSPVVANIAAADLDNALTHALPNVVYTRYADDLTLSYDDPQLTQIIKDTVQTHVNIAGFKLNTSKTKLQCASQGRRIICGVAVDTEIHPTRKTKRKLRAALHQGNTFEANGLTEWCKLKLPKQKQTPIPQPIPKPIVSLFQPVQRNIIRRKIK